MRALFLPAFLLLALRLGATPVDPLTFTESTFMLNSAIGSPTGIAWAPDGMNRLFVARKNGEVRVIENGAVRTPAFASISPIYTSSECGLIGICFDPDFLANHYVYLFVTVSSTEQQIIRYKDHLSFGIEKTVLITGLPTRGVNHDGGGIAFGPDGTLFFGIGDNGNGTGVDADLTTLAAKVGRARLPLPAPAPQVLTPCPDNPFFDGTAPRSYIWARGFRNPFTLTFHPRTGALWVNSVGTFWEQVFTPQRGEHAGWNDYENTQPAGFLPPIIAYATNGTSTANLTANGASGTNNTATFTTTGTHRFRQGAKVTIAGVADASFNGTHFIASRLSDTTFTIAQPTPDATSGGGTATTTNLGGAITGGTFYDSTAFPAQYRGDFFFGDYNSDRIARATLDPASAITSVDAFVEDTTNQVDIATGPDGALYYMGTGNAGRVLRLAYAGTEQAVIVQPTALSIVEGGSALFTVRLAQAPVSDLVVTVQKLSGDTSLAVTTGAALTFTPANFATLQKVILTHSLDPDHDDATATFRVSAPGLPDTDILVRGIDTAPGAFAAWRQGKFTAAEQGDSAISGALANPDFDLLPNLLEYALDTAPKAPGTERLPTAELVNIAGTDYLALRYTFAKWARDIEYIVEAAPDPTGPWTPLTQRVSAEDNTPAFGLMTLVVRDTVPASAGQRFLRLRITQL